jgi:hypothetical protein
MFGRGGFWCLKVTIVSGLVLNIPLSPYIGMIPIFNMPSDLLISWFLVARTITVLKMTSV